MNFNSIEFAIFFIGVLLLYYVIPKKWRYIWLLGTSYIFYMAWNVKYVVLLLGVTLLTYTSSRVLAYIDDKTSDTGKRDRRKKIVLWMAICLNIGLLVYFKYMNFFASTIYRLLSIIGIETTQAHFDILLPVGISFIIFQSLGYTIDVYRGKIAAEKNILKYALFVSFFPQLVAGPIERSQNLLKQIQTVHLQQKMTYDRFTQGLMLMLYGYFQKVFVGDKLAIIVESTFANPTGYSAIQLIVGAVAFSIQIYCDFGGYSNIAIGAAKVLGFDMMENFNAPYFANSIQDFWRRWHISLSTWFRDYLYIPLGGNRKGKFRTYVNLMITFLVSGLWHGAQMHYVVWGGIHGALQILEKEVRHLRDKLKLNINREVFSYRLLQIGVTYVITTIAWIFFRAENTSVALLYLKQILVSFDMGTLFDGSLYMMGLNRNDMGAVIFGVIVLLLTDGVRYFKNMRIEKYLCTQNLWFKWLVLWVFIVSIVLFGEYGVNYDAAEFIYFQF